MILMNDFRKEPDALRGAMLAAVERVMKSGWYLLGEEGERFERRWAGMCGVRHGVGVGNGQQAIEIALLALNIGPGDEVITTPMTAFATVLAILRAGATPVLADIEPESALLSLASAQRCLSSRTRAVVLVHLYGQLADMDAWTDWCATRDIALVEDCAHAHLAAWRGRVAGSFGRVGAFSFYPTKNLGALGDAGMLVSDDGALAKRACSLRNYGKSLRDRHVEVGLNSRLDEIQAAILMERTNVLERATIARRAIAMAYRDGIRNPLIALPPPPRESAAHVHHLFVVNCEARESLQAHLHRHGIQTLIHYPIPVHHQKPCHNALRDPRGLPAAERHARTCLSLPCHPYLDNAEIAAVVDAVNAFAP
ncbi:MAG: DegT/DnrJ/EryC1/StrS family aminotransferase [Magnetococcales bacterium]|nr:DegT/DnrJ/EryC1/StrS family aminotransferase [Magnetococcales bacterium]